jgi:O-antigen/teichoic acid export membrane protein
VPYTSQKLAANKSNEINAPVKLSLLVVAVTDILMALIAPELIMIFAGSAYRDAIYAIPPLVSVSYFGFLYNTFANIEYYFEETVFVSVASIFAGILILGLNFILVPKYGYLAAAYASMISFVAYALMHFFFMQKTLKKHMNNHFVYDNGFILKLSIVFVIIILCFPLIYPYSVVRYATVLMIVFAGIIKRQYLKNVFFYTLFSKKLQ